MEVGITAMVERFTNYDSLGHELKRMYPLLKLLDDTELRYRLQYTPNVFSLERWMQAPAVIVEKLKENGYKELFGDDDDCGRLYYYYKE
jgi:hypothetical protein